MSSTKFEKVIFNNLAKQNITLECLGADKAEEITMFNGEKIKKEKLCKKMTNSCFLKEKNGVNDVGCYQYPENVKSKNPVFFSTDLTIMKKCVRSALKVVFCAEDVETKVFPYETFQQTVYF